MAEQQSLLERLNEISEVIGLESFYSINLSQYQISLQGKFSDNNTRLARELGVKLEYQEDQGMLKGESSDGKLRIVLT
jgi:hypothetical protein